MANSERTQGYRAPVVTSIGLEGNRTVVRVRLSDGRMMLVETNLTSFAKLAAAGIQVVNAA